MLQLDHQPEARRALERARTILAVVPGTQLETEFNQLQKQIEISP
ncbi:MAG TPA: hypothetical protein VHE61_18965 [Opitutaceae bacterium]|nr:hypothetical protein [Opitutaceae bacterium]